MVSRSFAAGGVLTLSIVRQGSAPGHSRIVDALATCDPTDAQLIRGTLRKLTYQSSSGKGSPDYDGCGSMHTMLLSSLRPSACLIMFVSAFVTLFKASTFHRHDIICARILGAENALVHQSAESVRCAATCWPLLRVNVPGPRSRSYAKLHDHGVHPVSSYHDLSMGRKWAAPEGNAALMQA